MIGIDKLSYQSRWRNKDPRAKFALYLLFMTLAMVLSPLGQAVLLVGLVMLSCYLLRISLLRYLKWLLIPCSFLVFGLIAIVLSIGMQPEKLLWGFRIGQYWLGIDTQGIQIANQTLWRSLLQTAIADAAGDDADVAQSMLVTVFNLAVASGGLIGGGLLQQIGPSSFAITMFALIILSIVVFFQAKPYGFKPGARV